VETEKLGVQSQRGTIEQRQQRLRQVQREIEQTTVVLDNALRQQAETRSRFSVLGQLQESHEGFSAGALAACLLVAAIGFAVHRPLARVPENALKFAVGVMLSAFGVFWTGEGMGIAWPGADLAIPVFITLFLALSLSLASNAPLSLRQPR